MVCVTLKQCESAGNLEAICRELVSICEKQEDVQTQIYIVSGALGGVLLIVIIFILYLFVRILNDSKRANGLYGGKNGDELAKRGFSTYTGPHNIPEAPINTNTTPPPPAPFVPALPSPPNKQLGYDNSNFSPIRASSAMNNGGVRVLPRDPPQARNNNKASYNEGYY